MAPITPTTTHRPAANNRTDETLAVNNSHAKATDTTGFLLEAAKFISRITNVDGKTALCGLFQRKPILPTEAIDRAIDHASKECLRAMETKEQGAYQRALSDQMNLYRIKQRMQMAKEAPHERSIVLKNSALQYEFKTDLSIYYVDILTGEITRYDNETQVSSLE